MGGGPRRRICVLCLSVHKCVSVNLLCTWVCAGPHLLLVSLCMYSKGLCIGVFVCVCVRFCGNSIFHTDQANNPPETEPFGPTLFIKHA